LTLFRTTWDGRGKKSGGDKRTRRKVYDWGGGGGAGGGEGPREGEMVRRKRKKGLRGITGAGEIQFGCGRPGGMGKSLKSWKSWRGEIFKRWWKKGFKENIASGGKKREKEKTRSKDRLTSRENHQKEEGLPWLVMGESSPFTDEKTGRVVLKRGRAVC